MDIAQGKEAKPQHHNEGTSDQPTHSPCYSSQRSEISSEVKPLLKIIYSGHLSSNHQPTPVWERSPTKHTSYGDLTQIDRSNKIWKDLVVKTPLGHGFQIRTSILSLQIKTLERILNSDTYKDISYWRNPALKNKNKKPNPTQHNNLWPHTIS